ncbi:MAG: hypothetical protein R3181_10775, partial [Rubricoccaceae bacterium]|nr:hypothetical protein [Rubricoccaceae bacterium]
EIVGVEGGTPLALTEGPGDTYPAFSPDGQHLAFLRCDGARCRPHRISALGTDERPLADLAAHPSGLAWSPDGRQIAYVEQTTESGPLRIAVLDLDTGRRRALTTPPATALGDLFPAFSPDGRHLAFVRRTDAVAGDLHVVPVAGGAPTPLTAESHQIARFCWFPDGRALLAASDRDGAFRLWRIPADGGPPTPLPLEAAVPIGPALSGDGTRLVVETWDLPIQLWRRTAGAPEPVPVAPSTRWDRMPALSPDGRRVAFVSTRSGHAELWVADLDGGDPRPITTLGGPAALTPQWSPDGRRIAFVVRTDGQSDVYAVAAEGGVPQRLTSTASDEVHPRWAPDGQTLYVGRRTDDRWGGVRLAPDGRAEVVAAPDAVVLAPSPDGQALWFARATTPGLWTLPLGPDGRPRPGAAPAPLGPDLAVGDATAWAVTRDGLLYLRRGPDGPALVRWAEGRTEVLFDDVYGLDLWAPALAASPDGTTVLLAHMGLPEIDVLVADLARR